MPRPLIASDGRAYRAAVRLALRKLTKELRKLTFERMFMLGTVLVILLLLILIGALPTWPYSRTWGYGPTGGLGVVLVILIVLLLLGRI